MASAVLFGSPCMVWLPTLACAYLVGMIHGLDGLGCSCLSSHAEWDITAFEHLPCAVLPVIESYKGSDFIPCHLQVGNIWLPAREGMADTGSRI